MIKQGEKLTHTDLNDLFKEMYKRVNTVTPDNLGTITTAAFSGVMVNTTSNQQITYPVAYGILLKKIREKIEELK